jgi:hypothetical protein
VPLVIANLNDEKYACLCTYQKIANLRDEKYLPSIYYKNLQLAKVIVNLNDEK